MSAHIRKSLIAFVGIAALMIALGSSLARPTAANAAFNGQQLQFVAYGGTFIKLQADGRNQNGVWTHWEKSFAGWETTYQLRNWWWKGNVTVTFTLRRNGTTTTRACTITPPTVQWYTGWWNAGYNLNIGQCINS